MGKNKVAIYPGSFDPITDGHIDILKRGLKHFDTIIIAILANTSKKPLFSSDERLEMIRRSTEGLNVEIETFSGLLADYTKQKGINVIIRSLRATSDFDYEFQMAILNHNLNPEMESIFLMTGKEYFFLSSSSVKEVARLGGDVSNMVPETVAKMLTQKFNGN